MAPNKAPRNRFTPHVVLAAAIILSVLIPGPVRNALAGVRDVARPDSVEPRTGLEAQSPSAPLWTGTGHFVLESIGYTDGTQPRAYTSAPNFRQASNSLGAPSSTIPAFVAADVYVNFNFSTAGKSIYLVYTTNGTAPTKSNGTSISATFSRSSGGNSTWYATIPLAPSSGTVVNYVFYASDGTLAASWGRISGTTADRTISQYQTTWTEGDAYFSYTVTSAPSSIVISQIYGAGGNSGATLRNDYVELFNRGSVAVPLNGMSIQYAGANGSTWDVNILTSFSLQPGQYYLVQLASGGAVGTLLPAADATGTSNMAAAAGKVALVSTTTALSGVCPVGGAILDFVGFGSTATCQEGATKAPAPSTTTADFRAGNGCTDTDVNGSDFMTGSPAPRNSSSTPNVCPVATPTPTATTIPTATPTSSPTPTPVCGGPITIADGSAAAATRDGAIGVGEYSGYSCGINSGFGNVVGGGSKLFLDSDGPQNLFLGLQTGGGGLGNFVVVYIDSKAGGFANTTTFSDNADTHRAAISAFGSSAPGRADIMFATGFQADYAIAIDSAFAGLWELGSGGPNSLLFKKSLFASNSGGIWEWDGFNLADLGLSPGGSFRYVVTYLNPSDGAGAYRSNEFHGVAQSTVPGGNIGVGALTLALGDFNTFTPYNPPTPTPTNSPTAPNTPTSTSTPTATPTNTPTPTSTPTPCATYQPLPFAQNWNNTALIATNDVWSGAPGFCGYRGDGMTGATGADPQTLLGEGTRFLNVSANQTAPNSVSTGGVTEFELSNSVVALAGSGTASAPWLILHLNTVGCTAIIANYTVRDLETIDDAVQQLALQYRLGSGNFANIPAAYVADATTPGAIQSTYYTVSLPPTLENQANVQLRWLTTNAAGNDEWIGIDDILVTGAGTCGLPTPTPTNTPIPPTATNTPTETPIPTDTPTNTPIPPTATSTPTDTPVPPTATNTPTETPIPTDTPTNTPIPTDTPTNTPIPTDTPTNTPIPTDTPTNTPIPPTATPTSTPTPNYADYCVIQYPTSFAVASGANTGLVYGRIYEASLTPAAGADPSVLAELGYGPLSSDPTGNLSWTWFGASFNTQYGNDDEYMARFTAPTVAIDTQYAYAYRFSLDAGAHFTYCDTDGAGTNPGLSFDPNLLGLMTVNAPTPTPTQTPIPPTATNTPTETPIPTDTPTATPIPPTATNTPTETPVPTDTPTATPIPPTATNTPTETPVPMDTPTATPIPPTATNTPTSTPVPPTATPTSTPGPLPPAIVSGIVRLQGRATPGMPGSITLVDASGAFGSVAGAFDAGTGAFSVAVQALAGGTTYTLTASHALYLPNEKSLTVFPGGAYAQASTTLRGGDADNSGAIGIPDLACVGGAFGGPGAPCMTGSSDLNGDGVVNIFDLVLAGANYGLTSPQPWP